MLVREEQSRNILTVEVMFDGMFANPSMDFSFEKPLNQDSHEVMSASLKDGSMTTLVQLA